MFPSLSLAINRITLLDRGGDATPGGASDVWMWEDGIGFLWELGVFMSIE